MPPEQQSEQNTHHNKSIIFAAGILLILLVGGYLIYTWSKPKAPEAPEQATEEIVTEHTDLAQAVGVARIPVGMPTDLPVELDFIFDSYSAEYIGRGATQHTVSYQTDTSANQVFGEYESYMEENGYVFNEEGYDRATGSLYGTRGNNDLSVRIERDATASVTLVHVTYIERN